MKTFVIVSTRQPFTSDAISAHAEQLPGLFGAVRCSSVPLGKYDSINIDRCIDAIQSATQVVATGRVGCMENLLTFKWQSIGNGHRQ